MDNFSHIARMKPPIFTDRLARLFRSTIVALHDLWPTNQDLAIVRNPDLRPCDGRPQARNPATILNREMLTNCI